MCDRGPDGRRQRRIRGRHRDAAGLRLVDVRGAPDGRVGDGRGRRDLLDAGDAPQHRRRRLGQHRLVAEEASSGDKRIVAMVKAVDPSKPLPEVEASEAVVLPRESKLDASGLPLGTASN